MTDNVRIVLTDRNPAVVAAWRAVSSVASIPLDVDLVDADVFETPADALLLPGNAFGFLDRGLELQVWERIGWSLQDRLRDSIREHASGELLVGQAAIVPAEGAESPYRHVVYAPIYRTPRPLEGTVHAYLAARGALLELKREGAPRIESLVIPGLGTGGAGLHPVVSARQLRYAIELVRGLRPLNDRHLTQLTRRELKLSTLPPDWEARVAGKAGDPDTSDD
ncbi:MAG TPA: Appr-1-p processing protein [Planctomycetota bacterium]|nr:Appr-1-p processing protein [Planctomycetota bacterium]